MERSSAGHGKGLLWEMHDIVTPSNFLVAVLAGLIGYLLVERLRDGTYNRPKK